MDVMRARVVLRERGMLDVADLALRFAAAHARVYARLSAAVVLPGLAVTCAAAWLVGWCAGWVVAVVGAAFAGTPFVVLASRLVFADRASAREAIRVAARALPGIAGLRTIQALSLALCASLAFLPWLGAGGATLFVIEVRLLEGIRGPRDVLRRASGIAWARSGTTFAAVVVLSLAPLASAALADFAGRELLSSGLELSPPASMFTVGGSWLAFVGWWAAVPLLTTARFLLYLDFRTRTEGWDIQTRFAAIARRPSRARAERAVGSWRPRPATLLAIVLGAAALAPREAAALPKPAQAAEDAADARSAGGYPFCSKPREPLGWRARGLCKHASAIPDCEGFAAACARAERIHEPPAWSARWLARLGTIARALATATRAAIWALVVAMAVAVMIPVLRVLRRRRTSATVHAGEASSVATAPRVDAEHADAETLLARAGEHARRGQGKDAMELYFAASLRALHERGAIRITRDLTNGECVRACADATARPALAALSNDVDGVQFGGQAVGSELVDRAAKTAVALVRGAAALVILLACAGTCGCGGFDLPGPKPGDDPSGQELWADVLTRQGWDVERLGGALSTLPMPRPGSSPVVVVDADRIALDDETREHLGAWVDAGGVLVLAGAPETWPAPFRPESWSQHGPGRISVPFRKHVELAELAEATSMESLPAGARAVAAFDDGTIHAAWMPYGHGGALLMASDELMTNAALARGSNAAAMVAVFARTGGEDLSVADEGDGVAPPSSPLSGLSRAGLGLGLGHALAATLLLFAGAGTRLTRPKPSPPPPSRPFADHVEAVGALYARAGAASVALAAYARFAEERLRVRNPRRAADVAALLAAHAGLPADLSARLWTRAAAATVADGAATRGDELVVLEDLVAAYSAKSAEGA
jgi:hypothetical protein